MPVPPFNLVTDFPELGNKSHSPEEPNDRTWHAWVEALLHLPHLTDLERCLQDISYRIYVVT